MNTPKIEVLPNPDAEYVAFLNRQIDEFNHAHWEIKTKVPLAVRLTDDAGAVIAGGVGKTFGLWLLIDVIWVSEANRGQDLGTKVLKALEDAARTRGCAHALLDTLGFQARPFYERFGYNVRWTQEHYPRDGHKFFMTKDL